MKCPNGDAPAYAHLFDAAATEDVNLVLYCRLCGDVRPVKSPDQSTPLDDLPYWTWRDNPNLERR